jgi:hypothetical protein
MLLRIGRRIFYYHCGNNTSCAYGPFTFDKIEYWADMCQAFASTAMVYTKRSNGTKSAWQVVAERGPLYAPGGDLYNGSMY